MSKAEVKNQSVLTKKLPTKKKKKKMYKNIKARHVINNSHLLCISWFLKVIMPSSNKKGHCTEGFAHV